MPQFTKGRWVFPEGKTCISTFDSDGYIEKNIAEVYADMPIPEFEANARLIAAAPVMYKLLKDFINSDAETDSAEYQLLQTVAAEVLNNINRKDTGHDEQPPKQR